MSFTLVCSLTRDIVPATYSIAHVSPPSPETLISRTTLLFLQYFISKAVGYETFQSFVLMNSRAPDDIQILNYGI